MIRIAICDDEKISADIISAAAHSAFHQKGIEIETDIFLSVSDLDQHLKIGHYNLLLLDIDIPGTDGIAYAKKLRAQHNNIPIIYVSNREDRIFESLTVHPYTFIRKSYLLEDAPLLVESYLKAHPVKKEPALLIQKKESILRLPIKNIIYVEGNKRYQLLHIKNEANPVSVIRSMELFETELAAYDFLRIHKGYLVNYKYIQEIGDGLATLTTGEQLPVSRRKITSIKEEFLNLLIKEGAPLI